MIPTSCMRVSAKRKAKKKKKPLETNDLPKCDACHTETITPINFCMNEKCTSILCLECCCRIKENTHVIVESNARLQDLTNLRNVCPVFTLYRARLNMKCLLCRTVAVPRTMPRALYEMYASRASDAKITCSVTKECKKLTFDRDVWKYVKHVLDVHRPFDVTYCSFCTTHFKSTWTHHIRHECENLSCVNCGARGMNHMDLIKHRREHAVVVAKLRYGHLRFSEFVRDALDNPGRRIRHSKDICSALDGVIKLIDGDEKTKGTSTAAMAVLRSRLQKREGKLPASIPGLDPASPLPYDQFETSCALAFPAHLSLRQPRALRRVWRRPPNRVIINVSSDDSGSD